MLMYNNFAIDNMTLSKCKNYNRYQREEFFRSKSINQLLLAIQRGYLPVGKDIPKLERGSKK